MAKKYLSVKFNDKELAKKLGAKWDPSVNRWYCPDGSALSKVLSWRAVPVESQTPIRHTPRAVEQISLFA